MTKDVAWNARRPSIALPPCTADLKGLYEAGLSAEVFVFLDSLITCEWTEYLSLCEFVILLQLCRTKGLGSRAVAPATKLGILFVWIAHPGVPNLQLNSCGLLMENRWDSFMGIQTGIMWLSGHYCTVVKIREFFFWATENIRTFPLWFQLFEVLLFWVCRVCRWYNYKPQT
jgi:hypothetical protein